MNCTINKHFTTAKDGNMSHYTEKQAGQVDQTRQNLAKRYNFKIENLKYMHQIHSSKIAIISKERNFYDGYDGLITDQYHTPLVVMVADCIPILFWDKCKGVIGVAHAGRNGTYLNISSNMVSTMSNEYDCKVENIEVISGPSIQKCCYEVSKELSNIAEKNFGNEVVNGRYIDLPLINKNQLLQCGVLKQNIEISHTCTKCGGKKYFSYRRNKNCGRFAGILWLTS